MKYISSNSLKRLFSLRRRSLLEHVSFLDDNKNKNNNNNNNNGTPKMVYEQREAEYCPRTTTWKCFSFEELSYATNCFSQDNYVGKGGYAEVYKGVLRDGREVAVKRLTKSSSGSDERKEKEFLTEIGTIGHVCHSNVLSLLGCCVDNGLYLIFHFSSKGSVASLLHDEKSLVLDWKKRYKIAVGTARGLHYLHKGCQRRIIHRDIKSSNILLTPDFEPLISDFGLAKWLPSQWSHHSIAPIEGTFGHLAPEYYTHGIVDEKTDVFAFGVFLLEIISGRKPVDGSHQSLHSWARPVINKGETSKLVDPRLEGAYDVIQLERIIFSASLCIRPSPTWRPTMIEVLEVMVDGNIDREKWKMPMEEEQEAFWGFEDLEECDCDRTLSISPQDTISTTTSS